MNGYNLLEQAARLTGLEQLDEKLKITGLVYLTAVSEEMGYVPPKSLSENLPFIGETDRGTALFGLAMFIANAVGEENMRQAFCETYNHRLRLTKNRMTRVRERMFRGEGL